PFFPPPAPPAPPAESFPESVCRSSSRRSSAKNDGQSPLTIILRRSRRRRPVTAQLRLQPVEETRDERQGRPGIVPAFWIVFDRQMNAALLCHVQEALDLGVEVELVPAAVGDVHRELAVLDV